MSRFRLALFTGNYNHIQDGVSLTLNRLVRFLMENNVDVLVFGPTIPEPALDHAGTFIPVPSVAAPGRPEYRISVSFPNRARKQLEEFDPDLIHIASPDVLGHKALRWALKNNKPVVSSYHTHFSSYLKYYRLSLFEPLLWKYLSWFYRNCRQLYVPTPSMVDVLREKGIEGDMKIWARGIEKDRFSPSMRDDDWRSDKGFGAGDVVITFVSRLVWEKNLKVYADVVSRLMQKYDTAKALVVGNGPAGDELKELLPDAVYTGFLKGEELSRAYASSDVFFFPSDTETFGNVTLEAMASGLPCVVADAVGSKSLVDHEENGFLAPADKNNLFYAYIEQLITDSEYRQKMGAASLEKAKDYSWSTINGNLLSYYEQILNQET
jgi:phosphatidylinositol alpha 1,6-mannosyltransferase